MSLPLLSAGTSLLGGIISGMSAKKDAKRARSEARKQQQYLIAATREDQMKSAEHYAKEQARLDAHAAANRGYDLQKLRDDALKAGFNPLTVLEATGAGAYDRATDFISSPFIPISAAYSESGRNVMDAYLGTVGASGGIGDAIANAGSAYVGTSLSVAEMRMQQKIFEAMNGGAPTQGRPAVPGAPAVKGPWQGATEVAGPPVSGGATGPFGSGPQGPNYSKGLPLVGANGQHLLYLREGGHVYVTPATAAALGKKPGDVVSAQDVGDDYTTIKGAVYTGLGDIFANWQLGNTSLDRWYKSYWDGKANEIPAERAYWSLRHPGNSTDPSLWGTYR